MLGGAKRVSMAEQLMRAGKEMNLDLRIYSHELDRREPIASVAKIIPGCKYTEEGALEEIINLIKTYKVDILLPFIDPAIELATRCKERCPELCVPGSSIDVVKATFDKVKSASLFESCEIPVPQTYNSENIKFPAILKPRTGSASKGIIVINSIEEFAAIKNIDNYLIQEYIATRDEYTLDCYIGMNDNEIKCIVPRIRLATAGGEVIRTQTCRIPHLISLGESVLKKLELKGAVTLQFIYDKINNRFLLMEINPRLGGGVICSIMAGADIATMILKDCRHEVYPKTNVWRDGTLMTRYFKEVIFYNDGNK